ncbi:MAG: DUF3043 domain-containing protein [Bifidobacteriaceae bacterium]|jgi:hypothetical protein|nr:DUF3043 domain-containing protein [Bifidobacteriaceae bacterium]
MKSSKTRAKPAAAAPPEPKAEGKGRPTPTRKQAEAVHKRPLGGAGQKPTTPLTKEQAKARRLKAREQFNYGMRTGDERYLPARDKGPVRRWTRDYIDSRRSLGEYIVIVALGSMFLLVFLMQVQPVIATLVLLAMYGVLIAVVLDAIIRGRKLKKALIAKFGEANLPRGSVWYGVNRSLQMRRTRMPNPQVKRGEHPS